MSGETPYPRGRGRELERLKTPGSPDFRAPLSPRAWLCKLFLSRGPGLFLECDSLLSEGGSGFVQGGGTVGTIDHLALRRHDEGECHTGLASVLGT